MRCNSRAQRGTFGTWRAKARKHIYTYTSRFQTCARGRSRPSVAACYIDRALPALARCTHSLLMQGMHEPGHALDVLYDTRAWTRAARTLC